MKDEPGNPEDQLDFFILPVPAEFIELHECFFQGGRLTFSLKKISKGGVQGLGDAFEGIREAATKDQASDVRRRALALLAQGQQDAPAT